MGLFLKFFASFLPCAFVSGLLYTKTLLALRAGNWNDSKARISRVFSALWLTWFLLNLPFLTFEMLLHIPAINSSVTDDGLRKQRYKIYWDAEFTDRYVYAALKVSSTLCAFLRAHKIQK